MQNTPARPGEVNMAERRVSGFKSELGRDSSSRARVGRLLGPIKTQAITIASLLRWAIRHVFSGLCHVVSLVPGGAAVPAGAREFPDIDALFGLESAAERDAEIDKYVSVVIAQTPQAATTPSTAMLIWRLWVSLSYVRTGR